VTGLDELCCDEWLDARNELDKYNKLAPLHYATMGNMMHIMMYLLENRADPEVLDEDDRTPMYYAQRDELIGAQSLLLDYGAKRSQLNDVEERGALFQGAAQVAEAKAAKSNGGSEKKNSSTVRDTDEELKSHQQAATKAHGAMNDAMNELRIRGEKINDLAEKANALEDNVNTYGDLAKQMKARAKKKKWYKL
jgi:ankyrin repeat protein